MPRGRPRKIVSGSDDGLVTVKITKFGAGKVSTGNHIAGEGDELADAGAELRVDADTAEALEERGFAEVVDAPAAPAN